MEAFIIALIVVFSIEYIQGPLGWGIVLTATLYFVFETISVAIQKSQKKMREEMDSLLDEDDDGVSKIETSENANEVAEADEQELVQQPPVQEEPMQFSESLTADDLQSAIDDASRGDEKVDAEDSNQPPNEHAEAQAGVLSAIDDHLSQAFEQNEPKS
jgi:hypothetical protein